jgi:hypothetical protein
VDISLCEGQGRFERKELFGGVGKINNIFGGVLISIAVILALVTYSATEQRTISADQFGRLEQIIGAKDANANALAFALEKQRCPDVNVSCQNLDYFEMKKVCLANQSELSQLQRIAQDNAKEHNYVRDKYDCTEFSLQLIQRLKDAGYSASLCLGMANLQGKNALHNWVRVDTVFVEATSGEIIDPALYSSHYSGTCG